MQNEAVAAGKIAAKIMDKYKLDLNMIKKELQFVRVNNCYAPGEVMDLDFLSTMVKHAV